MNDDSQQLEDYFGDFGKNVIQVLKILMLVVDIVLKVYEIGDYQVF